MSSEYKHPVVIGTTILSVLAGLIMLFFYFQGYDTSIGWSLTTESEMDEIVVHEVQKGPFSFQIKGEKITLIESFYAEEINPLTGISVSYLLAVLLGISLLISCATYLRQWGFMFFALIVGLFISSLNLGLFLNTGKWIMILPFALLIGSAFAINKYLTNLTFLVRVLIISSIMALLVIFIPGDLAIFSNHFFSNGMLSMMILIFLFLALISEEILFGLLFLLTQSRGVKGNEKHLVIIGGLYIVNLAGYYLNKAGIFEFTYTFMNPYVLLIVSFLMAIWSFKHKHELFKGLHFVPFLVGMLAMALMVFSVIGFGFAKGIDGIYEGAHYLIIYAHLGFGFMFMAYIILNFINPLMQGHQVYKILYKPQSFHFVTAKLGGLAMIAAFFFLSSQAALGLFRSAKYGLQGDTELRLGNYELAISYFDRADFYGFNTHYPNYHLGSLYLMKQQIPAAREYFEKATRRHPSAQACLNASNLQKSSGVALSTAFLEQALLHYPEKPELVNNLGIVKRKNQIMEGALEQFSRTEIVDSWNQAPQVNKWSVLSAMRQLGDENPEESYNGGDITLKANVISASLSASHPLKVDFDSTLVLASPYPLHRQAYLLNVSYLLADTVLQSLIDRELGQNGIGLQQDLAKTRAFNAYMTGRTREAFYLYDQMRLGKTNSQAGPLLNEMGILALEQGAPRVALDFFEKSLEAGTSQAKLNKLIAYLEAGMLKEAKGYLDAISMADSTYLPLHKSLANVFSPGTDTTLEARINEAYYHAANYTPESLAAALTEIPSSVQQMILQRLNLMIENEMNDEAKEEYSAHGFEFQTPKLEEWDPERVIKLAKENPFNERVVLLASEYLKERDAIEAYNFLHESQDYNTYSIPLLKRLAMMAVEINLPEYASPSLEILSDLLESDDYMAFEREWQKAKEEAENEEWEF